VSIVAGLRQASSMQRVEQRFFALQGIAFWLADALDRNAFA
jgi:hypothetical protein